MVSVLMPAKNALPYLTECLDSIIRQSYMEWELIVTNDHSTDETFEVLSSYAEKDKRIRVINNKGKGIIDALKTAYSISSGDYITRMDADDIMPENKLKLFVSQLENYPDSVVTGKIKYIGENLKDGYKNYEQWMNDLVKDKSHYEQMYRECVIPSPAWMLKRNIFEQIGGFNSNVYPEDYDLTFRMYKYKVPITLVDELVHIWRDYAERTSRNDPNYSFNTFEQLKTFHFLDVDYDPSKELVIWGCGKKGKKIVLQFQKHNIPFIWACNNPKKIGQNIYNVILEDINKVFDHQIEYQTIIAVANPDDQIEIKKSLANQQNITAFWFC
jgi:glycosyltransferase involved in cell wall biosynthesis